MNNIGQSLENVLQNIINFLPGLIGAILILIIGYFIAKIIGSITRKALHRVRFDRALHTSSAGNVVSRLVESPSKFVGKVVFWLVFLGVISIAISALEVPVLNNILNGIYSYIPNIIAAVIIFLVASAISAGAAGFVRRIMGRTALSQIIATVIPSITMSLAVFMILDQLRVAEDIVNILFTAIVGAMALGLALAFGLGGRDVARELLEQAVDSARNNSGTLKAEARRAVRNAKQDVNRATERAKEQL